MLRVIGFSEISAITLKRIQSSIAKSKLEEGVRAFTLKCSQFSPVETGSVQSLFDQAQTQPIYNPATLLWEVALNEGFPLDSRVETREVAGQAIQTLRSEFHEFALHCCFDPSIAPAAAPEIALGENDVFVCLDSALDDVTKLRLSDKGLLKTI